MFVADEIWEQMIRQAWLDIVKTINRFIMNMKTFQNIFVFSNIWIYDVLPLIGELAIFSLKLHNL